MASGVYGMRHKKTGKWYVGVSKNIEKRIKTHLYDLRSWPDESDFSKDANELGFDFDNVILEECDAHQFSEREKYWVERFDSKNNGYNRQNGGGNHRDWSING